jgi:competence protein ComFC
VRGRTVLLIDDVETTGATLRAAALELLRLGAREVKALTLFRVVERNN